MNDDALLRHHVATGHLVEPVMSSRVNLHPTCSAPSDLGEYHQSSDTGRGMELLTKRLSATIWTDITAEGKHIKASGLQDAISPAISLTTDRSRRC